MTSADQADCAAERITEQEEMTSFSGGFQATNHPFGGRWMTSAKVERGTSASGDVSWRGYPGYMTKVVVEDSCVLALQKEAGRRPMQRLAETKPFAAQPTNIRPTRSPVAVHNSQAQLTARPTMVIGMLVVAAIPTTIGVCEALSAQKKADAGQKEKAKFHLTATVALDGRGAVECPCILKDGNVSASERTSTRAPGGLTARSSGSTTPPSRCRGTPSWATTSHTRPKSSSWGL